MRPAPARLVLRLGAALALGLPPLRAAVAQVCPVVSGPVGNPIRDGTPGFTITTTGAQAADLPLQVELQVGQQPDFSGAQFADTTVSSSGTASIVVPRLLPPRVGIYWRSRVRTAQGALCTGDPSGPHTTSPWLSLLQPNGANGATVDTTRPTFLWSSVTVRPPVKPWSYGISIVRTIDGLPVVNATLTDTVFTSFVDLEFNTSYRWFVVARLATGDTTRVDSFASFVILNPNAPIATVLYQSFPSPFPNTRVATTCIWFDLAHQSSVSLDVLDLRGNFVATILPGNGFASTLPPGRYGRAAIGSDSGCDQRLTWDGRDDRGRYAPTGVYLIRLVADGKRETKKVLFKGR